MSNPESSDKIAADMSHEEMMSMLLAQMIMQQSSLAMMLMGRTPHPESGQTVRDMEGAKLFIDQLEMIELKTKGNLSKEEADLLKQSLMALRMAFVECVDAGPEAAAGSAAKDAGAPPSANPAPQEEHRAKFSKKY